MRNRPVRVPKGDEYAFGKHRTTEYNPTHYDPRGRARLVMGLRVCGLGSKQYVLHCLAILRAAWHRLGQELGG